MSPNKHIQDCMKQAADTKFIKAQTVTMVNNVKSCSEDVSETRCIGSEVFDG